MEILKNFKVVDLMRAEPGDLVQMTIRSQSAIAIIIRKSGSQIELGILEGAGSAEPAIARFNGVNHKCISYGSDWVLQPHVGPETIANNRQYVEVPGALHADETDLFINFGTITGAEIAGGATINIATLQDCATPYAALPIAKWSIWISKDDFDEQTEPFFTFSAGDGRK